MRFPHSCAEEGGGLSNTGQWKMIYHRNENDKGNTDPGSAYLDSVLI